MEIISFKNEDDTGNGLVTEITTFKDQSKIKIDFIKLGLDDVYPMVGSSVIWNKNQFYVIEEPDILSLFYREVTKISIIIDKSKGE